MTRVIAGDIGGTKTLLRCVESSGVIAAERRYDSGRYRSFDDLLREFLPFCPGPVDAACFAVAGPVLGQRAEITNLKWVMEVPALEGAFNIGRVSLINDFYAVALGVPLLGPADTIPLQEGRCDRSAPIAILGAGTGLGEAFVVPQGDGWLVIPSEGGHGDFAPQDDEQARLFLALGRRFGHVSWERVVSGMGIVNIFTFLGGEEVSAAEVAERAAAGETRAVRAFQIFVDAYGAEAGNMALRVLARGGVFLAGGVAAKNVGFFTDGRFLTAFRRKGRFGELLREFPVHLITNEQVGLIGAMSAARSSLES